MGVGIRQALEIAGMLLVAGGAFVVHPAAGLMVLGASAIWLANFGDWS